MISQKEKTDILQKYANKEEKFFVSSLLDKINQHEAKDIIIHTNFLDLNETDIAISVFNQYSIQYFVFEANEYCEKKVIFLLPSYQQEIDEAMYVSCMKIQSNQKLLHKDYMGAIYSLGLKREMIGDIFACDEVAYVFLMKCSEEYILTHLKKVARNEVTLNTVDLKEASKLQIKWKTQSIIVASRRIDVVLSHLYHVSRNEVKQEIAKGNVLINSKVCKNMTKSVKENDIVSFAKHGKLKIGKDISMTKNNHIVLQVMQYS